MKTKIVIPATWHYRRRENIVSLVTRKDREDWYRAVYPYQDKLGLNRKPHTKLRITIEVVE